MNMNRSDETSKPNWRNAALITLVVIVLCLVIAFIWHYSTAKPPESDLHTRPAAIIVPGESGGSSAPELWEAMELDASRATEIVTFKKSCQTQTSFTMGIVL